MAASNVANGYARATGKDTNAWCPAQDRQGPHWIELAWTEPVSLNVVHINFQTRKLAPRGFSVEVWQGGRWRQVVEVTDNRHRRHVLGLDRIVTSRLRVVEREPAGICEIRVYEEPQQAVERARRAHDNMQLPDTGPWLPWDLSSREDAGTVPLAPSRAG